VRQVLSGLFTIFGPQHTQTSGNVDLHQVANHFTSDLGPCVERFAEELTTLLELAAGAQKFALDEDLVGNLHALFCAQSLQVWHGP